MATMTSQTSHADKLRATLEHWYDQLRQYACLPDDMEDINGEAVLWIKTQPKTQLTHKALEGMELMALLAHADWELWKREAKTIWPKSECDEWDDKPTHVGLHGFSWIQGRLGTVFEWIARSSQVHSQSKELVHAREILLGMLVAAGVYPCEVPVRLVIDTHSDQDPHEWIFQILQLVLTQSQLESLGSGNKSQAGDHGLYNGLRVRYVVPKLHTWPKVTLTASDVQCVRALTEKGVAVHSLGMISVAAHRDYRQDLMRWLWELFAVGSETTVLPVVNAHVCMASPIPMIISVLTAMRASSSLRGVAVDLKKLPRFDDDRSDQSSAQHLTTVWCWVAYALCCGDHKSLKKVSLYVRDFCDADLRQIRRVVAAEDPLAVLLDRHESHANECVSAARFSLHDPSQDPLDDEAIRRSSFETGDAVHDLPVIEQSGEWVTVLLPGWGKAWVHSDDVLSRNRAKRVPGVIHAFSHITIDSVMEDSIGPVASLMGLIGFNTTHMTIRGDFRHPSTATVDQLSSPIFRSCPNLQSLTIKYMAVGNLQFLLDAYESGVCRVSTFKVIEEFAPVVGAVETLLPVVSALRNKDHPASRYLHTFVLSMLAVEDLLQSDVEKAIRVFLYINTTLRRFDLRFAPYHNLYLLGWCSRRYSALDGKRVLYPAKIAGTRRRLAFLSVLRPCDQDQSSDWPRAAESLDAPVVTLIFEFAGRCCKRRVLVGGY